ncbi:MAG: DUF1501 domain-containing protein [Acidobacteria bacterium]|nr:DUF1501 domain-containing protein [Acidobacteriota bacterium]
MDPNLFHQIHSRRRFLDRCAAGLGTIALSQLMAAEGRGPAAPRSHFPAKARNVIFLFMDGGPSHLDLYDPKPAMKKYEGQALPESMTKNLRLAFIKPTAKVVASPRSFAPGGQSGTPLSDCMPHLATRVDDICLIRSMFTDQFNHHPSQLMLNCGSPLAGRPSMGAWVNYGLGSESQSLPGFVVMRSGSNAPGAGTGNWTSGFLPSSFQGVPLRGAGDPVLYLSNPHGVNGEMQKATLDALRDVNQMNQAETGDLEIASRVASYELAFRMQQSAPELMDISKEPAHILELYGVDAGRKNPYARHCLLARRLVERGVRFVQLMHGNWDHHTNLDSRMKTMCEQTDRPVAALLTDLKRRGLLDSTLVVWGGEFGRTPMVQDDSPDKSDGVGRDHHPMAFSLWMAGGGIKGGQVVGSTDDFGLQVTADRIHVHDLQATILHCLGINHEALTYRHTGRDFRLTDVAGKAVAKLLA